MVQRSASRGLRSTRTTARHRLISDGGTSNVSDFKSLRKTHLTLGRRAEPSAPLRISIRGTQDGLHGRAGHAYQDSGSCGCTALGTRGSGGLTGVSGAEVDQHPTSNDGGCTQNGWNRNRMLLRLVDLDGTHIDGLLMRRIGESPINNSRNSGQDQKHTHDFHIISFRNHGLVGWLPGHLGFFAVSSLPPGAIARD
jgi:hypothetical protein